MQNPNNIVKKIKYIVLTFLLIFTSSSACFSQEENRTFLSAKASFGAAIPKGSFSKKSTKSNELGKCSIGINFHFDVEATYKEKYTLGIGYDISDFDVLNSDLDQKIAEANGFNGHADNIAFMDIQRVSLTASRRFQFKQFIFQLKGDFGGTAIYYGYMNGFYVDNPNTNMFSTFKFYESKTSVVFTAVPEINLSYIFAKKTYLDVAFNVGVNYCYMLPKIKIMESQSEFGASEYTEPILFTTLKDPISMLNINFGVIMFFKKKLRNK